jgi:hypothetical protein
MLVLRRLAAWAVEIALESVLLGLLLFAYLGYDSHAFVKDLFVYVSGIGLLFFTTGYLITTAIFRAFWRGRKPWPYSIIATALFLIHFEVMNVATGGAFEPQARSGTVSIQPCEGSRLARWRRPALPFSLGCNATLRPLRVSTCPARNGIASHLLTVGLR